MDNIFFRFLLQYWPLLIALVITFLVIRQYTRPQFQPEKIQKGIAQQSVLIALEDLAGHEHDDGQEWLATHEKIEKYLTAQTIKAPPIRRIAYRNYLSISLVWICLWFGASVFVIIRILLNPYYYGNEAIFLCYFMYYIIIGLISFYKR